MEENLAIYKFIKDKITENGEYCNEASIKGYIHALVFNVYFKHITEERNNNRICRVSRQQELFNRFMKTVQEHYIYERGIEFYANLLCVTPKYLSQIVHRVSGRYAGEYIRNCVILEAKVLIRSRAYNMQQISEKLHFTSLSFFGRYFKQATGYTPLQYQDRE
jgi:YesN/AraC family two-component response regulator